VLDSLRRVEVIAVENGERALQLIARRSDGVGRAPLLLLCDRRDRHAAVALPEVFADGVGLVPDDEQQLRRPGVDGDVSNVCDQGFPGDRQHRLGTRVRERTHPGAATCGENHSLHVRSISRTTLRPTGRGRRGPKRLSIAASEHPFKELR
jgi:hypothetical protein